jgi:hypothetical protein
MLGATEHKENVDARDGHDCKWRKKADQSINHQEKQELMM